jgi:hypothetical protein
MTMDSHWDTGYPDWYKNDIVVEISNNIPTIIDLNTGNI